MEKCCACHGVIEIHEFDFGSSFIAINPTTFRKGKFHLYCFELNLEESMELKSKNKKYQNRFDEYIDFINT